MSQWNNYSTSHLESTNTQSCNHCTEANTVLQNSDTDLSNYLYILLPNNLDFQVMSYSYIFCCSVLTQVLSHHLLHRPAENPGVGLLHGLLVQFGNNSEFSMFNKTFLDSSLVISFSIKYIYLLCT